MSTARAFASVYCWLNTIPASASYPNIFEVTTLQIVAVCPLKIKSTHQLVIAYSQADMLVNVGSSCSAGYACSFDGANMKVVVSSLSASLNSDTIYLNISNVVALTRSVSLILTLQTSAASPILTSTTSASSTTPDIITYNLSQSSRILSATSDLYLDYSFASYSTLAGSISNLTAARLSYLLVYIPLEYGSALADNVHNVTTVSSNGTGRITIANVTNPVTQLSGWFYISAFAGNGELLAISINNRQFTLACTLPCRTCPSNSPSACLSCYASSVFNIYLATNTSSSCISTCPRFYFLNSTISTCSPCDANCYECDYNLGTRCLSCAANLYLHEVDYKCYGLCPVGFFGASNFTCRSCASNCLACLN